MSKQPVHLENPSLASWGFSGNLILFQWGATFTWISTHLSRGAMVRAARHSGVTAGSPWDLLPTTAGIPWEARQLHAPWDNPLTVTLGMMPPHCRGTVAGRRAGVGCRDGSALAFGLGRDCNGEKLGCEALRTGILYILRDALRDALLLVLHPPAHSSKQGGSHPPLQPHRHPCDAASLPEPIPSSSLHLGMCCLASLEVLFCK